MKSIDYIFSGREKLTSKYESGVGNLSRLFYAFQGITLSTITD